jgi:hypothetical protein
MEESFPERPALFFDFVLPSWSENLFSNLWIADPHSTTPMLDGLENCEEVPRNDPRLDCAASNTNVAIGQFTHSPGCRVVGEIRIFHQPPRNRSASARARRSRFDSAHRTISSLQTADSPCRQRQIGIEPPGLSERSLSALPRFRQKPGIQCPRWQTEFLQIALYLCTRLRS